MRNAFGLCLVTVFLLVPVGGCGVYRAMAIQTAASSEPVMTEADSAFAPVGPAGDTVGDTVGDAGNLAAARQERKVIYTGHFKVVVADVAQALTAAKSMAEGLGGYMQRMTTSGITVRVPAGKFEQAVKALEAMGPMVHRDITAQDVTEQYLDLELRLRNTQALRTKLLELLSTTTDVKDALAVERELARTREQIERLEGQLKRLKDRVAYATLTVAFVRIQVAPSQTRVQLPFGWLKTLGLESLLRFPRGSRPF